MCSARMFACSLLALLWVATPPRAAASFEFLVDGKVDHCGTDSAQLVRVDGRWLIAALADNSRTDCARQK